MGGGADRAREARPALTVADLKRWEANGAGWRTVQLSERRAVVELCTCYGEPVDVLAGDEPALVAYVRAHGSHED